MTKQETVRLVLKKLNERKIRCTYGAVADLLRVPPVGVSQYLGDKRPEASWVVGKSTKLPSGYAPSDYHPELLSSEYVIESGGELKLLLDSD